jgi:hypothetical protein
LLEPVIAGYRGTVKRRYFHRGAAFAKPEIYESREAENMGYAIQLPGVVRDFGVTKRFHKRR